MGVEMEKKELDAESITTVNVKDYPPSEAFTAEPPPAYHRPKATSVQIARIAAFTVVLCSIILGAFILAAAYVNSNSACQQALNEQMARMDELLEERAALGPQYQALVGEGSDNGDQEEQQTSSNAHQVHQPSPSQNEVRDDRDKEEGDEHPVHLKLPLQLDFDEIAGALMDRNQRSRLNCVVEKRRADEVVDHQPRTVRLPFGLNLTTDPRYEHVSGERMAIFCESGHDQNQRHSPEMQGPTIVQAVPIHIQSAMQPQPQQQPQIPPQLVLQHMTQIMMQQRLMEEQRRQQQQRVEEQQRRQHQQQMIQQHLMAQAQAQAQAVAASQQQEQQQQQASPSVHFMVPLNQPEGRSFQPNGSPMSIHQIPLHAAMAVEVDARDGEQVEIEGRAIAMPQPPHHHNGPHQGQRETHLLPIEVIEAGPFPPHQASLQPAPAEGLRPPHERPPIYVVPQQVPQQPPQMSQQAQQQIDAEEHRPHYVQPRSVRSVDDVFHKREKRMRRCACDCSC